MPNLTEINIFPLKSCGQISVQSAAVEERGLRGDRRYMLVDDSGRFLTQREHPKMTLIQIDMRDSGLGVTAPGQPPLEFSVDLEWHRVRWVKVWRDHMQVSLGPDRVNEWFTQVM